MIRVLSLKLCRSAHAFCLWPEEDAAMHIKDITLSYFLPSFFIVRFLSELCFRKKISAYELNADVYKSNIKATIKYENAWKEKVTKFCLGL